MNIFPSGFFHKRNARRHVVTSLRTCALFRATKFCAEYRVETGAWIAWIMAEIEPYSFEPMQDSSESEEDDVHERQDERRRGNTSWCICECHANREGQQEKTCLCCKEIEEAVHKISGE